MKLKEKMWKVGIEQEMRYFYDEEAHKEEPENEVSEELVDLYKEYIDGEHFVDYVQLQLDRSLIEFKMNKKLNEGKAEGIAEGIAMERAKNLRERKERMQKRMMCKYHVSDLEWLETCDKEQLDIIEDLLDEDISYEELMKRVLWH